MMFIVWDMLIYNSYEFVEVYTLLTIYYDIKYPK